MNSDLMGGLPRPPAVDGRRALGGLRRPVEGSWSCGGSRWMAGASSVSRATGTTWRAILVGCLAAALGWPRSQATGTSAMEVVVGDVPPAGCAAAIELSLARSAT